MKRSNDRDREVWKGVAWIGGRLHELRDLRGMTLQDVGDRMGVSHSFVSKVESGREDILYSTLLRYCSAIGVDLVQVVRKHPRLDSGLRASEGEWAEVLERRKNRNAVRRPKAEEGK